MTQSTDFSPEDGAEFASLMGINEENDQSEVDEPTASETDDEYVDAPESDDEPDNSDDGDGAPQKSTETPKKKSWIAKVISQRNAYKAEVEELKEKIRAWEHTTNDFLEYTEAVSKKNSFESQEVQRLLTTYPDSAKYIKQLDGYADQTGDLESAYKALLAVNNPELYVQTFVSKQTQAKANSGKFTPAGMWVPKNNVKPVTITIDNDDASDIVKAMLG